MPYVCTSVGRKWELRKADGSKTFGTHSTKGECNRQLRALYAQEINNEATIRLDEGPLSEPFDFSMRIAGAGDIITVVVNGRGGGTLDAIKMHNALRNSGKKVHVYIPTVAQSAHAIVALAGDMICIAENGSMMFHPPMVEMQADTLRDSKQLEDMAAGLKVAESMLVNTLMSKTKKSEAECREIMSKDTYLTANEALALGIVDEIIPILRNQNLSEIKNYLPEKIVNFVKGKQNMPIKEICDQFGVTATAEDAETKLVEFIKTLQTEKKTEKQPIEVNTTIVNMVKKSRESELNILVQTGKAIPEVVNKLKVTFLSDDRIKSDIQNENQEYEGIVDAFVKNEEVFSFKNKSGAQKLPDFGKEGNPLVKDAEKRAVKK